MSVELAIVGVTLLLYGLELWEFFDEQFEKADNRLQQIKKCIEKLPADQKDDQILEEARQANECLKKCFSGKTRVLWMWVPGLMLFLLFPVVVLFQPWATYNLTDLLPQDIQVFLQHSRIEVWAFTYFLSVFIATFGAMLGFIQHPVTKFQKAKRKFPSCFDG